MDLRSMCCLVAATCAALASASDVFGQSAAAPAPSAKRGDSYYLAAAEVHINHAAGHAQLAEDFLAMDKPKTAVKEHAAAIRNGVKSSRKSHAKVSEAAKSDAKISKKLAEIAAREQELLKIAERLDPTIVVPIQARRTVVVQDNGGERLRIPQSYFLVGEGHFID